MNEAIETLKKYLSEESNSVHFYGDSGKITCLEKVLHDGIINGYDAPDLYIKYENEIWIIEHFEFDCFKANGKGSSYRQEQNRIDREYKRIISTTDVIPVDCKINAQSSYKFYVDNISKTFKSHYQKIESYKNNLINDGIANQNTEFIILFLIEDVSPLGATYVDNQNVWRPVILAHSKEFLDLLKETSLLDGVLAVSCESKEKFIWFIDSNQIDAYYDFVEDYGNCRFLSYEPHIVGLNMEIPNEKMKSVVELLARKEELSFEDA